MSELNVSPEVESLSQKRFNVLTNRLTKVSLRTSEFSHSSGTRDMVRGRQIETQRSLSLNVISGKITMDECV